jgi:hypothetical protein
MMAKKPASKVVRKSAGDIPPAAKAGVDRLQAAMQGSVDTSDISERPALVGDCEAEFLEKTKLKRIVRPATDEQRKRHAEIRAEVMQEIAAVVGAGRSESPPGLPAQMRATREAKGLTWYAVAKLAGIPNSSTVRDIEAGRDAQLSNVKAVARVLGLRLELVGEQA